MLEKDHAKQHLAAEKEELIKSFEHRLSSLQLEKEQVLFLNPHVPYVLCLIFPILMSLVPCESADGHTKQDRQAYAAKDVQGHGRLEESFGRGSGGAHLRCYLPLYSRSPDTCVLCNFILCYCITLNHQFA